MGNNLTLCLTGECFYHICNYCHERKNIIYYEHCNNCKKCVLKEYHHCQKCNICHNNLKKYCNICEKCVSNYNLHTKKCTKLYIDQFSNPNELFIIDEEDDDLEVVSL